MCTICASFTPYLPECHYTRLAVLDDGSAPQSVPNSVPDGPIATERGDAAASVGTNASIDVGGFFEGNISSSGDSDWIAVTLDAGQTYTIAVGGTGALDASLDDPELRIRDAAGNTIATDFDSGPGANSSETFTPTTSGTYYIAVESEAFSDTGRYGVSVVEGTKANYSPDMVAGALLRPDLAWTSTPETGATVTWAFRASGPGTDGRAFDASGSQTPFVPLSSPQRAATEDVMAYLDAISGLDFTQLAPGGASNAATMLFGAYNSAFDGAGAYAFFPGSTAASAVPGDVWLNNDSYQYNPNVELGSWAWTTLLHEVGHAIGLHHPGDYNAAPGVVFSYQNNAQFIQDSDQFTVMTYFDETNTGASPGLGHPDTFMIYDILAIHQLYGADTGYMAGNTTYGFNASVANSPYDFVFNTTPFLAIYDGSGFDTIDLSGYGMAQMLDLNQGGFSDIGGFDGNMSIAFGAVIEAAIGGSGDDTILGNSAANRVAAGHGDDNVSGGGNDDTLKGEAGADTLRGGSGDDRLEGNGATDRLLGGSGDDAAQGGGGQDTVIGGIGDDVLAGNKGSDQIRGGSGDDTIGGDSGRDTLFGGKDNDWLSGGSGNDTASGGKGNDTVYGNSGEDMLLGEEGKDRLFGGSGGDDLQGDAGKDTLKGGSGNDTLAGGSGNDVLKGGRDADTFIYTEDADRISDFNTAEDVLILEDALWGGGLTAAQVLDQFGATTGGDYVLDFGGGNTLTFIGGVDPDTLEALISFI